MPNIYAFTSPIIVAYQSSDLSLWNTATSTVAPASTAIGSGVDQVSSTAATSQPTLMAVPPTSSPTASGLSSGEKAGIGVGAALGGLAICASALFFFWRRRRRNQKRSPSPTADPGGKAELPGEGREAHTDELDNDRQIHEMTGVGKPAMLDHMNVRAELEGDWRGWEAPSHGTGRGQDVGERNSLLDEGEAAGGDAP